MFLIVVLMSLFSFLVHAQQQHKPGVCKSGGIGIAGLEHDDFKGLISLRDSNIITDLTLQHEAYADMGTFILGGLNHSSGIMSLGDWTVLKGSATDDNATVVELDQGRIPIYYFLRLKNGDLQQLDSTLHEIQPAAKHILKRKL